MIADKLFKELDLNVVISSKHEYKQLLPGVQAICKAYGLSELRGLEVIKHWDIVSSTGVCFWHH